MSENTEGTIKNGQSRETGNIDEEKQSKNTTQYALNCGGVESSKWHPNP
jgi:hypothetical protein